MSTLESSTVEEIQEHLKSWNEESATEFAKKYKVWMDESKHAELKLKIKTEAEKPSADLMSFLIKLDDENKILEINDLQTITKKIDFIESLLNEENNDEQKSNLEIVYKLLNQIKENRKSVSTR